MLLLLAQEHVTGALHMFFAREKQVRASAHMANQNSEGGKSAPKSGAYVIVPSSTGALSRRRCRASFQRGRVRSARARTCI